MSASTVRLVDHSTPIGSMSDVIHPRTSFESFGECRDAELGNADLVPYRVEALAQLIVVERDVIPDGWHGQRRYRSGWTLSRPGGP